MKYQPPHFYHAWHGINHAFHFERYYHRPLSTEERAVISALERQRQRGKGIRAIIHDPFLSLDALPDYFRWLTTVLFPKFDAFTADREFAVLAPTKRLARRLVCDIKLPRKRTFTFSWRTPDAPRGLNIDHLLVLGWRARHKSLRRILADYRPLQASLLPTIPASGPYSVMIVISRDPLPHFSRLPAWSYLSTMDVDGRNAVAPYWHPPRMPVYSSPASRAARGMPGNGSPNEKAFAESRFTPVHRRRQSAEETDRRLSSRRQTAGQTCRRPTAERFPHHYPHDSSWGNAPPPPSPTAERLHPFPGDGHTAPTPRREQSECRGDSPTESNKILVEGQLTLLPLLNLLTRRNAPLTCGEAALTLWPQGQKLNQAQIQRICA